MGTHYFSGTTHHLDVSKKMKSAVFKDVFKHLKIYDVIALSLPVVVFILFKFIKQQSSFSILLAIMIFPLIVRTNPKQKSLRFGIAALISGLMLLRFHSATLYYFLTVFVLMAYSELRWGKLNSLIIILIFLVSPALSNIVYIWSFPLRMEMGRWAGLILNGIHFPASISGNLITRNGETFSIDPACMGLHLIITAQVLLLAIIQHHQKKWNAQLNALSIFILMVVTIFLSFISNLIRILTLVVFRIEEGTALHDVTGILILILYVLLPVYFLSALVIKKAGRKETESLQRSSIPFNPAVALVIAGFALMIINGFSFLDPNPNDLHKRKITWVNTDEIYELIHYKNADVSGIHSIKNNQNNSTNNHRSFEFRILKEDIIQLKNRETLIYIKPPADFYQGSHDPRYCWQGSGYEFVEMKPEIFSGIHVFTARLVKDSSNLFTAWWYQDNNKTTQHEWDWRWDAFLNRAKYKLINVTCENREKLIQTIQEIQPNDYLNTKDLTAVRSED
ncbi:MAG: hypothetical protein GC181_07400 [Bacteroidetes bacterium]|nr:hypothetical protein [Bacteroidota bacterium]